MKTKTYKELRWVSRGLSGLIILICLFFFIAETFFGETGEPMDGSSILQLSIAGTGLIGLALAWKWELVGGILASLAFIVLAIINPKVLLPSPLTIWPATAVLFIILWAKSRYTHVKI